MNRNDDAFSRDRFNAASDRSKSAPPSKKTVEQFLDEMDAWDKIAAELDAAADDADFNGFDGSARVSGGDEDGSSSTSGRRSGFGFDFDADFRAVAGDGFRDSGAESDEKSPFNGATEQDGSGAARSEKTNSYRVSYDDVDKIAEDYETRSKYRERSVWNRGEWGRERRASGAFDRPEGRRDYRCGNGISDANANYNGGNGGAYRQNDRRDFERRDDFRPNGRRDYRSFEREQPNERADWNERNDQNDWNGREGRSRDGGDFRRNGVRGEGRFDFRRERWSGDRDYRDNRENWGDRDYREGRQDWNNRGGWDNRRARDGRDIRENRGDRWNASRNGGGEPFERRRERGERNFGGGRYQSLEPTIGARGKRGEPLSLAEEIAERQKSRFSAKRCGAAASGADSGAATGETSELNGDPNAANDAIAAAVSGTTSPGDLASNAFETVESLKASVDDGERQIIAELEEMSPRELVAEARRQNLETIDGESRRELVVRVLRARLRQNGLMYGEGTLEILPDEFGFLRGARSHYRSCPDDIYISPSQIRRFGLRDGLSIFGQIRPPKERERYFALLRVESINDEDPNALASKPFFDDLPVAPPAERVVLETTKENLDERILDLCAPLAFGSRGMIFAPPRSGKSTLINKMASAVLKNCPDAQVFVALIDERPEEITEMERALNGPRCEVVGTTFDEPPARCVQVGEIVFEKARRAVEYGRNAFVFLDSLTSLARAWNAELTERAQASSTPLETTVLTTLKKRFADARNVDGPGSLTLIFTADVDPKNQLAQDVLDGFNGVENYGIWLDSELARRKIWPPIDLSKSGAVREELFLSPDDARRIGELREKRLAGKEPADALNYLREKLAETENNAEFLARFDAEKPDAEE